MLSEKLTDEQNNDFENAKALAWKWNEAFDETRGVADELADEVILEDPEPDFVDSYEKKYAEAAQKRELYRSAMLDRMPPRAVFDRAIQAAEEEAETEHDESFAAPEVWSAMRPEQKAEASEVRKALATGPLAERGVSADSLRVMRAELEGESQFVLVHTGNGIDIGDPAKDFDPARSQPAVMSAKNDALFQVQVGDTVYDARTGMTDPVYDAKVADARARGVALPDSEQLAKETKDLWTYTMLTGEPLTADGLVPVRSVGVGQVARRSIRPVYDNRDLRVCPAVVLRK